jgi:hypothetical protein
MQLGHRALCADYRREHRVTQFLRLRVGVVYATGRTNWGQLWRNTLWLETFEHGIYPRTICP